MRLADVFLLVSLSFLIIVKDCNLEKTRSGISQRQCFQFLAYFCDLTINQCTFASKLKVCANSNRAIHWLFYFLLNKSLNCFIRCQNLLSCKENTRCIIITNLCATHKWQRLKDILLSTFNSKHQSVQLDLLTAAQINFTCRLDCAGKCNPKRSRLHGRLSSIQSSIMWTNFAFSIEWTIIFKLL